MNTTSNQAIEEKIDQLIATMTLDEKIGQMNQYNGFWNVTGPAPNDGDAAKKYEHLKQGLVGSMLNVSGVEECMKVQKIAVEESRLGIPILFALDVIHGFRTLSPIPLAEAASWDLEAIEQSARTAATEASAAGIHWTFAPMVDIYKDPRWGRVMEGAGEDVYLGSKIAFARVRGFQGTDLSKHNTIAATAKHFAGYGFPTAGKEYNTVEISENTLHNEVFPPFLACLDANVRTFMSAFNDVNGVPATGNEYLQRTLLKEKWKFNGFVVSDWGSVKEMINHGTAKNLKEASFIAAKTGCDMDMESYGYISYLKELVENGSLPESVIEDAVRRILRIKFELGLFDEPYRYFDKEREEKTIGSEIIRKNCLEMAKKSIVLLKNDNQLLPLPKQGKKIAVIGALANDKTSPLGSWRVSAFDDTATSILEGLHRYNLDNEIRYAKGAELITNKPTFLHELDINESDISGFEEAKLIANSADIVVMVLGEHAYQSGEARSRTKLNLPGVQQQLLEEIYSVNQSIVLILQNGRPLAFPWAKEHIPAIIEGWQLGTEAGNAIAQVVYGEYNPSGKLPMTFPRSVGQVPIFYNYKNTGRPNVLNNNEVFWSHYIDESNEPLFPFGFGLSYTEFEYSAVELNTTQATIGQPIIASVTVTNIGKRAGKEVVQLYIRDLVASTTRPVRELKGFELIELQPSESKRVEFTITNKELQYFNNQQWIVDAGEFDVWIGGDSTTKNHARFELI